MFSAKHTITSLCYIILFVNACAKNSLSSRSLREQKNSSKIQEIKKDTGIKARDLSTIDKKQQQQLVDVYYDRTLRPILSPNGVSYLYGQGLPQIGDIWPYYGPLLNNPFGQEIGTLNQICTRSNLQFWLCEGVISNLNFRSGSLAFTGSFDNNSLRGNYIISAGNGDYLFRVGEFTDGNGLYPYERRSVRLL